MPLFLSCFCRYFVIGHITSGIYLCVISVTADFLQFFLRDVVLAEGIVSLPEDYAVQYSLHCTVQGAVTHCSSAQPLRACEQREHVCSQTHAAHKHIQ